MSMPPRCLQLHRSSVGAMVKEDAVVLVANWNGTTLVLVGSFSVLFIADV